MYQKQVCQLQVRTVNMRNKQNLLDKVQVICKRSHAELVSKAYIKWKSLDVI